MNFYDPSFWGPISNWVAATATFSATLVAMGFWKWLRRPRLKIVYVHEEPWLRRTPVIDLGYVYFVRVRVQNIGKLPAMQCIGKVTKIFNSQSTQPRPDRDPLQLRWAGVPDTKGFDPIHIARDQYDYLNVLYAVENGDRMELVTFPGMEPGFAKNLSKHRNMMYKIEVTVYGDNVEPTSVLLKLEADPSHPSSIKVSSVDKSEGHI